ncbi:MAG: BolA family transcriptional regulator [Candidatus Marinimicrobia bacterium]|nr:BolA family transcriptional regulator [Candidatus Neomarinimicrobiota bacterium]
MTAPDPTGSISTASILQDRITTALATTVLEIEDETHLHEDHLQGPKLREARGGGHFSATIVSTEFEGLPLVQRHRLVYAAVGDLMGGKVHALSMKTLTPGEWEQAQL